MVLLIFAILLTLLALAGFFVVALANGMSSGPQMRPILSWYVLLAAVVFWACWAFG